MDLLTILVVVLLMVQVFLLASGRIAKVPLWKQLLFAEVGIPAAAYFLHGLFEPDANLGVGFCTLGLLLLVALAGWSFHPERTRERQRRRRAGREGIPAAELAALADTRRDAEQLAADGRLGDGLLCLMTGLRRTQEARGRRGMPWADEMAVRWQAALDEYAVVHRIGARGEIVPAAAPPGRGDEASAVE